MKISEFKNIRDGWAGINSWSSQGIYDLYAEMVSRFDNAVFMELGTWVGRSTCCMASEIKKSGKNIKFYAVDFFQDCYLTYADRAFCGDGLHGTDVLRKYLINTEPYRDYIITIIGRTDELSNEFKDESFDFIFIDADHSYEAVKKDIEMWYPKVKQGGVIAGHDYDRPAWEGVCEAVDEIFPDAEVRYSYGGNCWLKNKQ